MIKDGILKTNGVAEVTSPMEKMNIVLTLSKEKGMSSDQIFKYFDADGDGSISQCRNGDFDLVNEPIVFVSTSSIRNGRSNRTGTVKRPLC